MGQIIFERIKKKHYSTMLVKIIFKNLIKLKMILLVFFSFTYFVIVFFWLHSSQ